MAALSSPAAGVVLAPGTTPLIPAFRQGAEVRVYA